MFHFFEIVIFKFSHKYCIGMSKYRYRDIYVEQWSVNNEQCNKPTTAKHTFKHFSKWLKFEFQIAITLELTKPSIQKWSTSRNRMKYWHTYVSNRIKNLFLIPVVLTNVFIFPDIDTYLYVCVDFFNKKLLYRCWWLTLTFCNFCIKPLLKKYTSYSRMVLVL